MTFDTIPPREMLLTLAGLTDQQSAADALADLKPLPATMAESLKRSATVLLALAEITATDTDTDSAFRDVLRDLMHIAVAFGIDWTSEERHAWADVRRERASLTQSGDLFPVAPGPLWVEGVTE